MKFMYTTEETPPNALMFGVEVLEITGTTVTLRPIVVDRATGEVVWREPGRSEVLGVGGMLAGAAPEEVEEALADS